MSDKLINKDTFKYDTRFGETKNPYPVPISAPISVPIPAPISVPRNSWNYPEQRYRKKPSEKFKTALEKYNREKRANPRDRIWYEDYDDYESYEYWSEAPTKIIKGMFDYYFYKNTYAQFENCHFFISIEQLN